MLTAPRVVVAGAIVHSILAARMVKRSGKQKLSFEQPTVHDNVCLEECHAKATSGYTCDVCKTLYGWDTCAYDATSWEDQTWQSKLKYFWDKTVENTARLPDDEVPNPMAVLVNSPKTTFDNWMHRAPEGRTKSIHAIGSICQVELRVGANSPYTGLLGPGVIKGLIRMGNALPSDAGMSPGLGFKFPRTGVASGDFVMLNSLGEDHSGNFFAYNQSNHVAIAEGAAQGLLKIAFDKATTCSTMIGLSDLTKYSQDGTFHRRPNFPFKLAMIPSGEVQLSPEFGKSADVLHAELDSIAEGTKLYTVVACDSYADDESFPDKVCGEPVVLGDLVTTSECTTSDWGDRVWQVRHQRLEEDWQLKPQYYNAPYDVKKFCDNEDASPTEYPGNCNTANSEMLSSDAM